MDDGLFISSFILSYMLTWRLVRATWVLIGRGGSGKVRRRLAISTIAQSTQRLITDRQQMYIYFEKIRTHERAFLIKGKEKNGLVVLEELLRMQ